MINANKDDENAEYEQSFKGVGQVNLEKKIELFKVSLKEIK